MPWKSKDVDKFKKGLSDSQKKEWVRTANKTLSNLTKEGKDLLESEINAIKKANSMFGDSSKVMKFSDFEKTDIKIVLAEVGDNDYQIVLPTGTTYDAWYGELIFTDNFMKALVDNQARLKNTKAFLNEQHDRGKACAWADDIKASEDGLLVKWDFTSLGKSLVEDKIYKYYSAEIGSVIDVDTGESVFPVFRGCALTNSPVMKNLPEVHLEESTFNKEKQSGGNTVTFEEIMKALKDIKLSEDNKKDLAKELAIELSEKNIDEQINLAEVIVAKDEVIASLNVKLSDATEKLAKLDETKVEVTLSDAIKAGKIIPADKEKWEKRLSDNFEIYSEIISELATVVDLGEHGSEGDEGSVEMKFDAKDFTGKAINGISSVHKAEDFVGGVK